MIFELTETTGPRASEVPESALAELREAGVRIAIDDFAHSPLTALQRMEIDMLKVDHEVVAAARRPEGELMLRAVVQLAHHGAPRRLEFVVFGDDGD